MSRLEFEAATVCALTSREKSSQAHNCRKQCILRVSFDMMPATDRQERPQTRPLWPMSNAQGSSGWTRPKHSLSFDTQGICRDHIFG